MVMFMDDWYAYLVGTHGAAMVRRALLSHTATVYCSLNCERALTSEMRWMLMSMHSWLVAGSKRRPLLPLRMCSVGGKSI
jgi:hypothetical protein